jgi:hypothetical protein
VTDANRDRCFWTVLLLAAAGYAISAVAFLIDLLAVGGKSGRWGEW